MKKVFLLFFVSFCFSLFAVATLTGPVYAKAPSGVPPHGGIPECEADLAACLAQPAAPVPQTGQTTCSNFFGITVPCDSTGQDGDFQAGVVPPDPRFTDNGDGTITDNLTGLVWLQDGFCSDLVGWQDALDFANGLYDGCPDCGGTNNDCGLSDGSVAGDWRLPNRNELTSLLDFGNSTPALPSSNPFIHINNIFYWSSTTVADNLALAWIVDLGVGTAEPWVKQGSSWLALPVRGGL